MQHPKAQLIGLVPKLIVRTARVVGTYPHLLRDGETMLSGNKVTGISINFPIAETCRPTKVCASTCYFARDATTWPDPLKKQYRVYNTVVADPVAAANRLAVEVERRFNRKTLTFLRWNGGGDLFPEAVVCLNNFARKCPYLPIWVVTRLPELAAEVDDLPNVFVHFSLDQHSTERREQFLKCRPKTSNYFFSYQCDRNEQPVAAELKHISVLFYNCYEGPTRLPDVDREIICPLNTEDDISGVCEWCRRCFDGQAVSHAHRTRLLRSRTQLSQAQLRRKRALAGKASSGRFRRADRRRSHGTRQ